MDSVTKKGLSVGITTIIILSIIPFLNIDYSKTLDPDEYVCSETLETMYCVNGVKANGQRCYNDEENKRKYNYCPGLWVPVEAINNYFFESKKEEQKIKYVRCDNTQCYY